MKISVSQKRRELLKPDSAAVIPRLPHVPALQRFLAHRDRHFLFPST
ncbi:hypothetical protein R75465_05440 [Paraburkholderia aspalathi]|nr:hypothetical protein [Paraburkholderia aspalathi]CAE6811959.1 hypothetical protein R75465_05440 [Paraburkholderia aspalathi]